MIIDVNRINQALDNKEYLRVYVVLTDDELGLVMIKALPHNHFTEDMKSKQQCLLTSLYYLDSDFINESTVPTWVRLNELTDIEFVGSPAGGVYIKRK